MPQISWGGMLPEQIPSHPVATLRVHYAEEVPFGVREHDEVGAIRIRPIHILGTERTEPLDFGELLLFAGYVQVEMSPVGLVQEEDWAFAMLRDEGAWVATLTEHVAKDAAPEVCRSADVGDVQHH